MNESDIQTSKPDYIVFVPKNKPDELFRLYYSP